MCPAKSYGVGIQNLGIYSNHCWFELGKHLFLVALLHQIEFNGAYLAGKMRSDLQKDFGEIEGDYEEFKKFTVGLFDRVPRLIGNHINDLELRIVAAVPAVRHINIEIN